LTFANAVRQNGSNGSIWTTGFAFSSLGVIFSFFNSFWTWNITRLNRRIYNKKIGEIKIFSTLKKYSQISVGLSLVGMFITLLGAEQIVGTLTTKVLSSPSFSPIFSMSPIGMNSASNTLQALDIFLVQANTNSLLAHFVALFCYIVLQTQIPYIKFKNVNDDKSNDNISPIAQAT
jgi:hypothetical protein